MDNELVPVQAPPTPPSGRSTEPTEHIVCFRCGVVLIDGKHVNTGYRECYMHEVETHP